MADLASIGAASGSCAHAKGTNAGARALQIKVYRCVFIVQELMRGRRIVK